ncbi:MAG: isoprenylcysteine carboxylmethyltransferase family protein [Elusimicrobiota bacterium]
MKKRILISNITVAIVLIMAKPDSFTLFFFGIVFVFIGEFIRLIASAAIKKNRILATRGIYSVTRNPLYLGTSLIAFGTLIQICSVSHFCFTLFLWAVVIFVFSVIYYKTIKAEEKFLLSKFGEEYIHYCKNVPAILPNLKSLKNIKEIFKRENYSKEFFIKNKEYRGLTGVLIVEIIIFFKLCHICLIKILKAPLFLDII